MPLSFNLVCTGWHLFLRGGLRGTACNALIMGKPYNLHKKCVRMHVIFPIAATVSLADKLIICPVLHCSETCKRGVTCV